MKVKMLVSRAGVDTSNARGDVIEVGNAEGARMIAAGQAEPVRAVAQERAVKVPRSEKAQR